ncbi:MAG: hypothetical protein ACRCTA_05150, partial [Bacilli bacterium]
ANVVIHYDPWWTPPIMNQASDRAHRILQMKVVQVFNLVTKNSIEEKIIELQAKKNELINNILSGDIDTYRKLSDEQIRQLLLI